eukprot:CAMPEP_0173387078 /NCGR_PEP_ID=MMETSP1356-20130122/9626_1 /TAXON_ID=77927 ORGANISM="Hemiselmis virescens, Strain PCC157" /NCGR_SAMPLE_ID=MMETSP1356 /ASSEMBLY_ACC=CAM_ASM_000847 /LENGTH=50 /DNA_ID=CAMNT_0014343553 /DNA_START=142 /DNA_END=290 /DNA_ORIENTATION=-
MNLGLESWAAHWNGSGPESPDLSDVSGQPPNVRYLEESHIESAAEAAPPG